MPLAAHSIGTSSRRDKLSARLRALCIDCLRRIRPQLPTAPKKIISVLRPCTRWLPRMLPESTPFAGCLKLQTGTQAAAAGDLEESDCSPIHIPSIPRTRRRRSAPVQADLSRTTAQGANCNVHKSQVFCSNRGVNCTSGKQLCVMNMPSDATLAR